MERHCDTCGAKAHFFDVHCHQCGLKLHASAKQHQSDDVPDTPPASSVAGNRVAKTHKQRTKEAAVEQLVMNGTSSKDAITAQIEAETDMARPKIRLSVTVHTVTGLRLRQSQRGGSTKLYWSLRLLSASGSESQRAVTHEVSVHPGQPLILFDDTVDFFLEFEGQVLEMKLKERDTVFGHTVAKRDYGCLYWQVYSDKLSRQGLDKRSFR